jgi:hypothetical protein
MGKCCQLVLRIGAGGYDGCGYSGRRQCYGEQSGIMQKYFTSYREYHHPATWCTLEYIKVVFNFGIGRCLFFMRKISQKDYRFPAFNVNLIPT